MDESATVLFNVEYFIHGRFDKDNLLVHVVSTDENSGLILRKYDKHHKSTLFPDGHNTTANYFIFPLDWRGEIEKHYKTVTSLDELKSLLDLNANFGVWGNKQLNLFSKLLPHVVDVSSHLVSMMEEPLAVCTANEPPLTIGKVFINITSPFKKNFQTLAEVLIDAETENFKDWIERIAWPALLNWYEMPKDEQNDGCDCCWDYDSGLGGFSTDDE
ncbi:hypothetical protein AVEN_156280-1 [Araneus ventricosus]|uniref:Uncharacterized protein n=1 Tax=Araneus ventricosus TaxID=182803 RepID=A0A4Y2UEY2_ARAVE|nr:hypothetical protein AVEN_156280-1 [Araneus ventricosus]